MGRAVEGRWRQGQFSFYAINTLINCKAADICYILTGSVALLAKADEIWGVLRRNPE